MSTPGGRERWQTMVRRARNHLVAEGWKVRVITEAGRAAAIAPSDARSPAEQ